MSISLQNICRFYENLNQENLPEIRKLYAADAQFKDPFNEVHGIASIEAIFLHMFSTTQNPKFKVLQSLQEANQALLVWNFYFEKNGFSNPVCIHGTSLISFNEDGKVLRHRDYWDSGEELYAKLPWVGGLFRWLALRIAAPRQANLGVY
jgi:steroid Delta-isomerase